MSENKNDWRSRVKAMMTDPKYAEKMASVVDNTRKVNTDLMNKSEEYESSLSLDKPASQPLDLARVDEMKAEDAARATMPSEDDNYSGVSDLATKVYAEERKRRIGKALQRSNTYFGAPHGMRLTQAAADIYDVEKAKDIQGIYDKVLQDGSVSQAIHTNANKALLKAMEANQSLSEEEQKKVYDDAVSKQLEAIGKGIDKYLYDINAPKSEAEWVAKNAVNSSIVGQMLTSPMNVEGGENAYRQQALADYGAKASWLSQGVSMAGSLIIDTLPMMGIGTAFAAPASKAAMWGVGKVGGKALQGSLIGRGIVGSVGGAATLGGYNAASSLTTQFSNGQFDLGEITSSAGHGALMGGLTGVMSPVLRGVSQGMGKVGKAATMAGGLGAEAGIFSAAELAEMENPYDFETIAQTLGKNVVVIGGLKLSNPIKTIGEYKRWYNEGKQSNFNDADYKMMADFAKANGYANNEAFSMSADGVYSRSIADRVTGNRTLLEMTKLEGGKERNLAIEMYNDPNVPISLKTKIAAKMNLPAPKPLLANGVRVEGNKAITYCTMPNGAQQVIEIKEFQRPRNARAFANEFSRTTARKNDLMQTEAAVNNISTEPIVIARLNEQAKRNGTTYEEELARLNDIVQRAAEGAITPEDIAYYTSIVDTDISATEAIKQGIKDEYGVEIDDVLKSDGNLTDAQDKALTAYADALRSIVEQGNPTTERMLVASTSGVADYVALNRLGIEQTRRIMENPTQRAEIDAQMRSKYGAWLKYFDGKMGEDALAAKLGYDLNNSTDLQNFLAEQTYFKNKAADRIAANTTDVAKQLLEQGGRGVRFTEGGKVKLQGVPYPIEVSQDIVDRYDAAMQGSGEPMSRIVNDALKDIIKQSETPSAPKEPIMEEMPDVTEQPMTDADAVTQQMVDARLAEIDTDLQGIEADGVQRMTINGRPVAIIKGRIVADADGKVDKTKSSIEVAYMLLDENGRPIIEDGKPKIEVGVKPSNVRVEDIEQWRSVDDYKAAEEQRIRDNNRLADEAMQMADEEMRTEEMPAESKAEEITDPQTTDELLTLCNGDRELALDVAMDELNRAQQSKGKGANAAETMAINQRIRTYQRMVDELSKIEETPTEAPTEQATDTQVTDDMEFIYQKDLGENHEGMEPMQLADGRYKWVGLQRGELTATMGERDTELLDGLAKKLGVAIIPIDVADSAVNGYYRDGNIYVNTNRGAEWTMRWVAGHEMLHDVAKKSPEAYDAYKQAVLNMWDSSYIDNQVKQIIDDYAASGKTIDREQALTELVNDFGGDLFSSRDGLNILDNILKDQSSKGNTSFIDTIKKWWDNIKEFFGVSPYANEVEKKLADAYKEAIANAEEFGRNYDFDYSIIGKRGAANLDKAEEATIRLDNLAVAREMELSGKDAKAIRMATGWERGADNKWRYEIPDELDLDNYGMVLNVAIDKAKWKRAAEKLGRTIESLKSENDNLKAEVERRRMIPSIEKMLADNENIVDSHVRELKKSALLKKLNFYKSGLKYKDSDDVEKMWADLKDSIGKVDVLKLSEVLGADNALFKAYPELADIDVRFDDKGYTSVLATVSNDGKEIWINPHNIESQSSVFLHEIQHLIQKIEGFAKGGSSRMFDIPEEHKYANMPGNIIKSMREQAEFARKKLSQYSTLEEIREYYNANRSWLTGSEKDAIISVMDALMYGESVEDGISSLEKDYQQAIDDLNWSLTSKDSPYSKYTRLGGEVEARNVQNRMNMSEEERRNTLLSETEDVAREDQILLYSNLWEDLAKEFSISRKIDEKYPNWLEGTTTSSGKHSTQVAGTIGTYRKVGKWIKENLGNDIRILDASSGMGLGTEALRKDGMQIDDVEPYQSEERKKTNPATFSSYKDINGKYDFIISNAVLNVIPDDWRSNVLHDMVARLNNGGRLFINTRKAGEEKAIKDKIELDSPQEILVKRNGKIASYQRFFTPIELKEWVENELGEGYSVEIANEKNSGTKGLAAVVVRKLGEQPTDPNGGGKPTEEFSIKADKELEKKSLVGVHNLTEDNLRYALNLGGLANPSTAVIDKNIMGLEGFGDISLIMPKSLVAKSTGKNAGTFAGDAYTPRFPKGDVVKYITKEGEKAVAKDYPGKDKFSQDFRSAIYSLGDEYGGVTPTLYYMYKLENGGADIIKTKAPEFKSDKHKRMVEKFGQKEWYELSGAEKQELFDYKMSEKAELLKGEDKELVDKLISDFANTVNADDVAYEKLRTLQREYKKLQNADKIDYNATYRKAENDVALAGEQADFNKWLSQISVKYGIEDRIFRGFTPSGNRKYAPLTLANLSKVMKEQGRAGEESFMSKTPYALRAKMLPTFKTLESIRKNKGKITDEETYNKSRKEISSEYNDLISAIVKLPNVKYDDAYYVLEDALTKGFTYAEKTANTKFDDATKEEVTAFGKLLTEAPSKYFETKFERPVMFNEFVAAIVPKDINPELRKALTDNGLAVEEYDRGDEASRLEAIRKASDRDDVQFSVKGKRADESVLDYAKRMSEESGKKNLLNGGSYFSGGGLLEEGLKGIVNPTIAVEFNQKVAGVYRNNFGEHIVTADVRDVDPAALVKDIDGPVAYFHASPVCKNFSRAKRNAEELPLDKETAQSTAKFISEVRPKIVTIENVKGYRNSEAMKIILDELEKQGYNYDTDTYNAADYGAYTSRERLIVRAVRDWSLPPKPIKMLADERPSGWLEAVADLIDGLPQTKNGVPDWMDVRLKAMGIDYRNIDKPLYVFGSGYSKDRIGCAFSDELVPALRTKGGDIIVMPDGRVLKATPRVLARISGMSDDYVVPKTDDLAHTIVGNGIPVQLTKAVMGSLIENVKSDLDSGATEYSIIGKRGAANLDRRDESGIRADNLVTAEDMEKAGKDAKIIRMATGWERGADGKWRYEIADAKLLPWEVWSKKRAPKLKDIVENADELFAAYPELEDVKVKKSNGKDLGGSFANDVITLEVGLMKTLEKYGSTDDILHGNKTLNSTLIHEIQHYIQDAEGFAQGGSSSTVIDGNARKKIKSLIDEINDDIDIYNSLPSNDPLKQRLNYGITDKRAKLKRLRGQHQLGYVGYHRLAGEVEARNAEKRLDMTEEERKNSLLVDTEDEGRDRQIVYGNTNDEYSIKGGKNLEDRLESKYTQTRLRAARELAGDDESALMILDDLEPHTLEEYVAEQLGANGRKLLWENGKFSKGLKAHLGVSENEKKTYRSIISKDGYPPEVLAEEIWKSMPEEFYERYTDQDVFNTILDLASSYTRKQLKDFVVNKRIDAVIEFARKQEEWDAAQEEMYLETLSEQERNAYLANKEEMERVDKMSKKERAEYYKQKQVEQMLGEMTPEERAEYEAKEQWRKENAGAITSSFFAERRLDKADKIQKLKDEINKLIKETRATNKENSEKVKEIAKEMQNYIKENIPTETQGDMTRTQFEQVIKQLSTAITRKDLEEPMRMVEYIGANANRRALTRQMRDFLKQGFKGMTPKGLVKAKNVDGATSRVLGLAKSLYESMGKQPLGSDLRALQTKVRGIKAELEDLNNANGGAFSEYVEQINNILKKSGVDRYEEMTKYYNELSDRQDVGEIQVSEVLDHINRMLPELFSIELVKEQRTQAKADSAMTTKEDLEQLRSNLEDKREKGILSEEDQAVLDNMAMYELMVDLQQRQLDIDGPGTSSIASQMAAKVREAKQYRDELEKYDDKKSGVAKNLKDNIKRVNAEMEELFVQRTQAQKEVNANVAELLDNLKQLRDTGNSALKEWSKNKQERETRIVNMANASFGKDARGYWSEVDRRGGWKRDFSNRINNLKLAALMSPALSFEYMVGVMDPRFYTNESPIYKQFIKGEDGLIKANDNFFEGLEAYNNGINEAVERFINRNAMQSLKEYFNKGDRFATEIIPFEFEVKENVNGEVVTSIVHRDAEMTRGQAAKIYAWSRMADGMAKLKAHGVTDDTMKKVMEFVGEDYMNFIDWVEDVYFPKLRREKYNPIYKQMYGISMAENEHYFPFLIYQKDVRTEQELEQPSNDKLGGGVVGNLVERTRNNARLDFTAGSPDIFDMITDYGKKMEEWAAYAQVREDLKKVVNNKQFKQHCDMLGTSYYKYFLEAAQVASRLSRDMAMTQHTQSGWAKAQKVFASSAISLRVSTALKQLLSAPAFMVYSLDPVFQHELIKTVEPIDIESAIKGLKELVNGNTQEAKKLLLNENWVGHYNWCVKNLPSFRERVSKRGAGNPILEERGFGRFADDVQAVGMLPNRLVDAFTCSVGAKAIYEYTYKKFKKNYDDKTAHNMAVTEAEIAFNTSQQSSNPVFLAPMQASKQFFLRGMMNYKNSPIGYYRAGMKANIDLYRATKALFGKPKFTINGEQAGFEGNGVNPAAKAAEAAAKSIMFNFFLNYLWAFGTIGIAGVSYTMMNNDNENGNMLYTDEEFDKATGGNMGLAVFNAATQGIPWVSGFASVSQTGQDYTPSILFSEMNNYLEQVNKEGFMSLATAQLLIDLGLKNAIGVDPEVWGQIYRGAQGIMADRPMRTEDFMNLLASPRSAIAGVAKQKVGEYNNMQDYVNARIESEREIGINETMDLGKKLTGLRPLRKSKLDGYIDEYLADKIPDYRELANKPDEKAKEERMEESNAFKNLNTLVSTVQHTEEKKKSSKKIDGNEETKDKVKKIRKAVNVIHKLYAIGDASSAQRIADELERRLKRGYNENGATLDDKLKNVDIYDSTGTTEQRGTDGFDTMFDRAMLGGFDGVYLGSKLD